MFIIFWDYLILICTDHNLKKYENAKNRTNVYNTYIDDPDFCLPFMRKFANCVLYKGFILITQYANL